MAVESAVDLQREIRGLRFADPAQEQRLHVERQQAGLGRARATLITAIFVATLFGLVELWISRQAPPDFLFRSLVVRFLVVAPLWLAGVVSTYLPGHDRRAELVFAGITVGVALALAYLKWSLARGLPNFSLITGAGLDVILVMLISGITLPMRIRWIAGMWLTTTFALGVWFLPTLQGRLLVDAQILVIVLLGIGALFIISMRGREKTERQVFAQREQLESLNMHLARLSAERQEFMAIAAHDLRAPLASVGGLIDGLRNQVIQGPEKTDTAHRMMREMVEQMLGLVDSYLGGHAAEAGQLPVHLQPVKVAPLFAALWRRHEGRAAAKQQRLQIEEPAGDLAVTADAALLTQILDNFVGNALKFSPAGSAVELFVMADKEGARVRLVVGDEGPGVSAAEQDRLFRIFGRTGAKPTAGEKSHGIGLAVTKRLAQAMGGAVGCESPRPDAPAGAEFWVELKRADD